MRQVIQNRSSRYAVTLKGIQHVRGSRNTATTSDWRPTLCSPGRNVDDQVERPSFAPKLRCSTSLAGSDYWRRFAFNGCLCPSWLWQVDTRHPMVDRSWDSNRVGIAGQL